MNMRSANTPQVASEAYFRQLCEHAGIALIGTDAELNICAWNTTAARMFGAAADRMIGTPVASVIPQERRRAAELMLQRAIRTRETIQFEFEHRDERGQRRELAGTIAPVLADDGNCLGASVCIRDISRRIALENEVHQSRKMVALGELAGAIAHHFNNILGGVITSVDYALSMDDPQVAGRVLQQISRGLQRATALIQGLQSFAEGDQHSCDQADFHVTLQQVAAELREAVRDRNIAFSLSVPTLPPMRMPHHPVLTILRNIGQNAVEAMPNGGSLHVEVALDRDWVVTRVSDTGCGLDEEAMGRIFEPFWSTKGQLSTQTGTGVGLGLAIAHGLVQMIGGAISVTSKLGEGSCFKVSLPIPRSVEPT